MPIHTIEYTLNRLNCSALNQHSVTWILLQNKNNTFYFYQNKTIFFFSNKKKRTTVFYCYFSSFYFYFVANIKMLRFSFGQTSIIYFRYLIKPRGNIQLNWTHAGFSSFESIFPQKFIDFSSFWNWKFSNWLDYCVGIRSIYLFKDVVKIDVEFPYKLNDIANRTIVGTAGFFFFLNNN